MKVKILLKCLVCNGIGKLDDKAGHICGLCMGKGKVWKEFEALKVEIKEDKP